MNDYEIRLECLRLAVQMYGTTGQSVLELARSYEEFVFDIAVMSQREREALNSELIKACMERKTP